MRKLFVLIHRYAGLTMTVFLILVGLTGSVLAFYHEFDRWELLTVPVREGPMLDPLTLRELAEALEPRARIDHGRSWGQCGWSGDNVITSGHQEHLAAHARSE